MIKRLKIKRFKRFRSLKVDLKPLTVLSGANSTGKSSLIQAVLLAREASSNSRNAKHVMLNGPYGMELGETVDVISWEADKQEFELEIFDTENIRHKWRFKASDGRNLFLNVSARPDSPPPAFSNLGRIFSYLGADRYGPRDVLPVSSMDISNLEIGARGEFVAQILAVLDREAIGKRRSYSDSKLSRLDQQTELWLSHIVRPLEIKAEWFSKSRAAHLLFKTPGVRGEWARPPNMGFGVSYSLPIIVAGLLVPKNGILIVENPEAHLHPAGQSAIGAFLVQVASDGVQVILETHSDHVLNGIRRAVVESPRSLAPTDTIVHFFHPESTTGNDVTTIELTRTGAFSSWPSGFFDQIENDLGTLARLRTRKKE